MSRRSWVQTAEGRWALAVAWCWCVEQRLLLDFAEVAVRVDEALEKGDAHPPELRQQETWALIFERLDSATGWRRVVDDVGPGVRGIAKVLYEDAIDGAARPASWRTAVGLRRAGAGWEVVVGMGSTLQQAGSWLSEADARRVAAALRPGVEVRLAP